MARYRGPQTKKSRAFGESINGYDKNFEKRKYPPGQHGNSRRRGSKSEYAIQLMEKQKAKYTYGVLERQFAKTFEEAARRKGPTGENLLKLLELRLDNTIFRLGFAPSRRAARQMVVHKHITVNGHLLNIPSYEVKMGDVISIRDKSKELDLVLDSLAGGRIKKYPWLSLNSDTMEGQYSEVPNREQIPENIKEQLIVELYSK